MTNKEAIKIIKSCNMCDFPSDYTICEIQQALDMAINALSQMKPKIENSNVKSESEIKVENPEIKVDLISRDEAVECCFNGWNKDFNEIAEDIKKLPTYPANLVKESGVIVKDLVKERDLISRKDLLNAIWRKEYGIDYDGVNLLRIKHIDIIENIPSAEKTASEKLDDIIVRAEVQNIFDLLTRHTALLNDIKMMLPSAENTAEWIKQDYGIGYRCTNCGKIVMADDSNELNFCCNCGARTKGGTE